jgi:hypothetical protein
MPDASNRAALIKKSDAMRWAKIVKATGVSVEVEVRGVKIIIRPDEAKPVDVKRRPAL